MMNEQTHGKRAVTDVHVGRWTGRGVGGLSNHLGILQDKRKSEKTRHKAKKN